MLFLKNKYTVKITLQKYNKVSREASKKARGSAYLKNK
jgi:hypothetical protein